MAKVKPRLFRADNEVMFDYAGQLFRVGPGETVDYIPPDAIGWLTEQGVITELGEGVADIVVAGATDAPTPAATPAPAPAAEPAESVKPQEE
jgi:hypothetical protein